MGYRDVLNTIYESYEYIPIRSSYILQLHRDLYKYSEKAIGGRFKNTQNVIAENHADGTLPYRDGYTSRSFKANSDDVLVGVPIITIYLPCMR